MMRKLETVVLALTLASCVRTETILSFNPKDNPCRNFPGEVIVVSEDRRSKGRCVNGLLQGEVSIGYDEGNVEKGLYVDGKPHEAHTLFTSDGSIEQVQVYDRGRLVYAGQWLNGGYDFRMCDTPRGPLLHNP